MPHFQHLFNKIEQILLTLWLGGMWFLGYIATPVLFASLDSRQLAGLVAGHLFSAIHYTGLVCGGVLLLFALADRGQRQGSTGVRILILMLLLVVMNQFLLQPMMAQAKLAGLVEGSESAARFARLHGISSILYLVTSVLGLVLVLRRRVKASCA